MNAPATIDLSTVIGRIIALLRKERGYSQSSLARHLSWDRNLLARIEAGRNTANIDNIFELEEVFMNDRLIVGHGDLVELCSRVVYEARRRGLRTVIRPQVETPQSEEPVEAPSLDRIVGRVVDDWLEGMRQAALQEATKPARKKAALPETGKPR